KLFDFPQKKIMNRTLIPLASLIVKIPFVQKVFKREMRNGMIMPLAPIVKKAQKAQRLSVQG
ncbi:MAG TPA: hypothetical protein VF857_11325, partial [Spirochaetota bacterium]